MEEADYIIIGRSIEYTSEYMAALKREMKGCCCNFVSVLSQCLISHA